MSEWVGFVEKSLIPSGSQKYQKKGLLRRSCIFRSMCSVDGFQWPSPVYWGQKLQHDEI